MSSEAAQKAYPDGVQAAQMRKAFDLGAVVALREAGKRIRAAREKSFNLDWDRGTMAAQGVLVDLGLEIARDQEVGQWAHETNSLSASVPKRTSRPGRGSLTG